MTKTHRLATVLVALSVCHAAPNAAVAVDGGTNAAITEYKVPYPGRPRDPFVAGADEVWFVGQTDGYLARLTPSTGKFFKRDLGDGAGPHNTIVGKDGIVWIAGNLNSYIGRYDRATDTLEKIAMPDAAARDPHTMVFDADQTHIWFTVQHGNFVGRMRIDDRKVELVKVPTEGARPYGIKIAPDGTPWIVLLGTNKLATVDPASMTLTEVTIPHDNARPRRLEITADGRLWYADFERSTLGSYAPKTKDFAEWRMPSGDASRPYGMASDSDGRVWIAETGIEPNQLVGFDTATEKFVATLKIPSGGGVVRHMDYHAPTNTVWFGADTGTIGKVDVEKAASTAK